MLNMTLLASQNGLGHSRRLFYVGCALQELGFKTTLFLGASQSASLKKEMKDRPILPDLQIIRPMEVDGLHTPLTNYLLGRVFNSVFDDESVLISDNIILNEPDSPSYYLHGHFNWVDFERLTNLKKGLLVSNTPSYGELKSWLRLDDFQLNSEIPESKCHSMPFLRYQNLQMKDRPQRKDLIWLSQGTTNNFESKSLKKLISAFPKVTFIKCESFKLKYESELPMAVLGRPGLGTIRDCLEAGVAFIPVGSSFDVELNSNVRHLVRLGLLEDADNSEYTINSIFNNSEIQSKYFNYWRESSISMQDYASRIATLVS